MDIEVYNLVIDHSIKIKNHATIPMSFPASINKIDYFHVPDGFSKISYRNLIVSTDFFECQSLIVNFPRASYLAHIRPCDDLDKFISEIDFRKKSITDVAIISSENANNEKLIDKLLDKNLKINHYFPNKYNIEFNDLNNPIIQRTSWSLEPKSIVLNPLKNEFYLKMNGSSQIIHLNNLKK